MSHFLLSLPMWFLNGCLSLLYWLAGHIPEMLSLLFGLVIAFLFDPPIQKRATGHPRRYERGTVQTAAPTATYFTLVVLGLWLIVSSISKYPIPAIGAAMWFVGLISILAGSEMECAMK